MAYLETNRLTKRYGKVVAADQVDLRLERGQVLCLLGPSGCGKTTTLRMIAGLIEPDEGEVWLDGRKISDLPTHRRQVGLVFQNWALFPHLSVFENIAFGLRIQGLRAEGIRTRVAGMLELVRLPDVGERRPSQLSGGQQQRVALARTLVTNPRLILFDEPLSNLDLKLRQEMRFELRRIQRELNLTTVYVTHDQGEALSLGDTVAVMRGGQVLEIGPPDTLFERPQSIYVADFLGVENIFPGHLDQAEQVFAVGGEFRIRFALPTKAGVIPAAVGVRAENVIVTTEEVTGTSNRYSGVVRDLDFQGSRVLCIVELTAGGIRLRASPGGARRFKVGDRVNVACYPEHVLVLF